jgi:DHA1 family tetracycline resistance protein-like MFS transporter
MGAVAPLIAGGLYALVSPAAPYWLGVGLMIVAVVVVSRAHITNTAKRPVGAETDAPGESAMQREPSTSVLTD